MPMPKMQTESARPSLRRNTMGHETALEASDIEMSRGTSSPASLSDEEIMWDLRNAMDQKLAGDLFTAVFNRYETPVRPWCLRFTSYRRHTFDLTQEIFFKVYRYTHPYCGASRFSTWLDSITRDDCCNSLKKKGAEPVGARARSQTFSRMPTHPIRIRLSREICPCV